MNDPDWQELTDGDKQGIEVIRQQLDRELGQWLSEERAHGAAQRRARSVPVVVEAKPRRDPTLLRVAFGAGAATLAAGTLLAFFPTPDFSSSEVNPAPTSIGRQSPSAHSAADARMGGAALGLGPVAHRGQARSALSEERRTDPAPVIARRAPPASSPRRSNDAQGDRPVAEGPAAHRPGAPLPAWPVAFARTSQIQSP